MTATVSPVSPETRNTRMEDQETLKETLKEKETLKDTMWNFKEAVHYLGCSDSTLRNFVRTGQVQAYRLGKHQLLFKKADLDGLIQPVKPSEVPPGPYETLPRYRAKHRHPADADEDDKDEDDD